MMSENTPNHAEAEKSDDPVSLAMLMLWTAAICFALVLMSQVYIHKLVGRHETVSLAERWVSEAGGMTKAAEGRGELGHEIEARLQQSLSDIRSYGSSRDIKNTINTVHFVALSLSYAGLFTLLFAIAEVRKKRKGSRGTRSGS